MKKNLLLLSLLTTISSMYCADFRKIKIGNYSPYGWNIKVSYDSGAGTAYATAAGFEYKNYPGVMRLLPDKSVDLNIPEGAGINVQVFPFLTQDFSTTAVGNLKLNADQTQQIQVIDIEDTEHPNMHIIADRKENYKRLYSIEFDKVTLTAYQKKKNQ